MPSAQRLPLTPAGPVTPDSPVALDSPVTPDGPVTLAGRLTPHGPVTPDGPAADTSRGASAPIASQRRLFFLAAGLLVAGDAVFWAMLAAVQSDTGMAAWDGPVHYGLVATRNAMATAILAGVSAVTSPVCMAVAGLVLAAGWAIWKRELWRPALLLGAMAATFVLSTLIKHAVDRGRPPAADFLLGPDDALSFPSGHTFGTGVFLLVLAYLVAGSGRAGRPTAVVAYAAAAAGTALVALSRLYLGYHWLTDVTASVGLAVAVTGIVILADGLRTARGARP
ncbi:membrane-associated phospholipid phosphatase [Arthrobacter sp. B3I9]|uniref:phosphatase PAP2 family protein n=1 Tax=Arthrobacter sp. B3I9 TaxID=3042270 RepID=UPI00278D11D7|nr:phosphatase PAP2 family protein [Arthrobacter sp. B3I9]MDQ0851681.1 membrane-associated phospholipid phosphatase [Arthrobacter sp. B3I9]